MTEACTISADGTVMLFPLSGGVVPLLSNDAPAPWLLLAVGVGLVLDRACQASAVGKVMLLLLRTGTDAVPPLRKALGHVSDTDNDLVFAGSVVTEALPRIDP